MGSLRFYFGWGQKARSFCFDVPFCLHSSSYETDHSSDEKYLRSISAVEEYLDERTSDSEAHRDLLVELSRNHAE